MTIRYHRGDLPDLSRYTTSAAIDTETMGLNPHRDRLCVVQLSPGDGSADVIQIPKDATEAPNLVKLLTDLDLFETREANFTPRNPDGTTGKVQKIAEYFAISEDKLKALPADKLVELRDNGALGQIYAHLVSLLGWDRLIALAFDKAAKDQLAAGNA